MIAQPLDLNVHHDVMANLPQQRSLTSVRQLTAMELFAGAGGMALGFENNDFDYLLLNDQDKWCCDTLRKNRPHWPVRQADIATLDFSPYRHQVDVLSGGLPYLPGSMAGKQTGVADNQGNLFFELLRAAEVIQPKIIIVENVKSLLTHANGRTLTTMIASLEACGYQVLAPRVLKAIHYRVPQRCERVFIIAIHRFLDCRKFAWPQRDVTIYTLRDALKAGTLFDADVPDSACDSYSMLQHKFMSKIPPGGNWRDLPPAWQKAWLGKAYGKPANQVARRLSWNEPCLPLLAQPIVKSHERCHPDETRPLTVREYARIQTFPDNWEFQGPLTEQYRHISHAVPVNLATAVAGAVKHFLITQS